MTPRKNIVEDYLNYDLTEKELDDLAVDYDNLTQIEIVEVADKLSNEFFRPGYEKFILDKKEHFRSLIVPDEQLGSKPSEHKKSSSSKNIVLLVLAAIALGAVLYLFIMQNKGQDITKEEVKQFALLSYESTGVLSANRSSNNANATNQLAVNYGLLRESNCADLILDGKYPEQELWSQLYCAYLNNDEKKINYYKSQIINEKYANYLKL